MNTSATTPVDALRRDDWTPADLLAVVEAWDAEASPGPWRMVAGVIEGTTRLSNGRTLAACEDIEDARLATLAHYVAPLVRALVACRCIVTENERSVKHAALAHVRERVLALAGEEEPCP